MSDYSTLDTAILETLKTHGPKLFCQLTDELNAIATRLAKPDRRGSVNGWRVIDRRLQALRKAGKIVPHRTQGWKLAEGPKNDR